MIKSRGTGFLVLVIVAVVTSNLLRAAESILPLYTLAGSPSGAGDQDGIGAAAKFSTPAAITIDPNGNVYVSENAASVIRKITPARVVTTIAGSLADFGLVDGAGSAARFYVPIGLASDEDGNIYVVDIWNHAIRKVSPDGVVTTLAGTGIAGNTDGIGRLAQFNEPTGIAVDSSGVLYVSDYQNSAIRSISKSGDVSTLCSDVPFPTSVAVGRDDVIYVVSRWQKVGKVVNGHFSFLAGTVDYMDSVDGIGAAAHFGRIGGIAIGTTGDVIISDEYNSKIRKMTPSGEVSTVPIVCAPLDSADTTPPLYVPSGIAIDKNDNVFVVDRGHRLIRTSNAPVFSVQPESKVVPGGDKATVSVTVRWPNATFQWSRNGVVVPGATSSSFTINDMSLYFAGDYTVDVSDGTNTVRSDPATITLSSSVYSKPYAFRTLSGIPGVTGSFGGTAAKFNQPEGIAFDQSGNAYVADSKNNTIRKVTPRGMVTTFAGQPGIAGTEDGVGENARFSTPYSVVIDGAGNLYVSDNGTAIRKITPERVVSTLAGKSGAPGNIDGPGSSARFASVYQIAIDKAGTLYATDLGNGAIRKISQAGDVTNLVAPGPNYFSPVGIAVDQSGNVYVSDSSAHYDPTYTYAYAGEEIWKITPDGQLLHFVGTPGGAGFDDGVGQKASFFSPSSLTIDRFGNLYVIDPVKGAIRRITMDGVVTTYAKSRAGTLGYADGKMGDAQFNGASSIAVDYSGVIYLSDTIYSGIQKITPDGMIETFVGQPGYRGNTDSGGIADLYNMPTALAVAPNGDVYVTDTVNQTVRRIGPTGESSVVAGQILQSHAVTGINAFLLSSPHGITTGPKGEIYIVDTGYNLIRKLVADGRVETIAGMDFAFDTPLGIAADNNGNIYVADALHRSVKKITPAGLVSTISDKFLWPTDVASDNDGNIYVSDGSLNSIYKITSDGTLSLYAGSDDPEKNGSDDGMALDARFNRPEGLAVDKQGNIFVADTLNHTIRKVASDGHVTTLAGFAGTSGSDDGVGSAVRFLNPSGIDVSDSGDIYVADTGNHTIRVGREVEAASRPSQLINISTRALCRDGEGVTIGGFVVSGNQAKHVLVRAVGPTLTAFGMDSDAVLNDPMLEVHDASHGNQVIASNDNWGDNSNATAIQTVTSNVGAFPLLPEDVSSSAMFLTLAPGVYTFVVHGKQSKSGIVLIEAYDADAVATDTAFVNLSTRAFADHGASVAIGGFVISGKTPKHVLLRAVGPTLSGFGIGDKSLLEDPTLELHDALNGNRVIGHNDDWAESGAGELIKTISAHFGALALAPNDATSSALYVTLLPGAYTFIASGSSGSSGIVLVEVYAGD